MRQSRLLTSAVEDVRREKAFYREINLELAQRFQLAVEQAIGSAAEQPLAMQELEFGIRRWPVAGFPHGVLYRVEKDFVLVLSVFHPSLDPEKWRSRVRG